MNMKFFVTTTKGKRTCACGNDCPIKKGEKIIVFSYGRKGNLKFSCALKQIADHI